MESKSYQKGFLPYALAAFLVGAVGGFGAVLGPAVVQDMNLPYNNTTWISLALAMSTAACAPILGKLGDAIGRKPPCCWASPCMASEMQGLPWRPPCPFC